MPHGSGGSSGEPNPGTFELHFRNHGEPPGSQPRFHGAQSQEAAMGLGKGALLWLIGIPIPIIILLMLFLR